MSNANRNDNIYGTLAEFKKAYAKVYLIRIGSFADEDPPDFDAEIDTRLTDALKDASDRMDGFIMGRYDTPVDPAPDYFEVDCYCIAVMLLIQRKGYEPETSDAQAVKDGKECVKKYQMIAEGKIDLPTITDDGDSVPTSKIEATSPTKIFNSTTLDKF